MSPSPPSVARARRATRVYERARERTERLRVEWDAAVLTAATEVGVRRLARELGVTSGRVGQLVTRARAHRAPLGPAAPKVG
jgi:phosphoserine phosphatase